MTPPVGIPSEMDPFALDPGTAERLVTGAVDVGDAPPEYRTVARVLNALRPASEDVESAAQPAAVGRIAAAVVVRPRPQRRARRSRRWSGRAARLTAAAVLAAAVCVTGGLASAGSLPEPAQNAASTVLGTVGISVPTGADAPAGVEEPPPTTTPPAPAATNLFPSDGGSPAPSTGVSPPTTSNPAVPGNGQGTPAHGAPPSTAKGHRNDHVPNGSPPLGAGNGKSR